MNNRKAIRESHSLSFHPKIWRWLNELAVAEYEGNVSAAVTGLILYDRGVRNAKLLNHEPHGHYITVGIPQDIDRLESTIMEIESLEPGFNAKTWLECERERAKGGE